MTAKIRQKISAILLTVVFLCGACAPLSSNASSTTADFNYWEKPAVFPSADYEEIRTQLGKEFSDYTRYPFVRQASIQIVPNECVLFYVTVYPNTTEEQALHIAHSIVRRLNEEMAKQDPTIAPTGENFWGGTYEFFMFELRVGPEIITDWYINGYNYPGMYRPIEISYLDPEQIIYYDWPR